MLTIYHLLSLHFILIIFYDLFLIKNLSFSSFYFYQKSIGKIFFSWERFLPTKFELILHYLQALFPYFRSAFKTNFFICRCGKFLHKLYSPLSPHFYSILFCAIFKFQQILQIILNKTSIWLENNSISSNYNRTYKTLEKLSLFQFFLLLFIIIII